MKKFTIHTPNCPDDCTYGWTVDSLMSEFEIDKKDIDKLNIDDSFEINCDLTLCRDE